MAERGISFERGQEILAIVVIPRSACHLRVSREIWLVGILSRVASNSPTGRWQFYSIDHIRETNKLIESTPVLGIPKKIATRCQMLFKSGTQEQSNIVFWFIQFWETPILRYVLDKPIHTTGSHDSPMKFHPLRLALSRMIQTQNHIYLLGEWDISKYPDIRYWILLIHIKFHFFDDLTCWIPVLSRIFPLRFKMISQLKFPKQYEVTPKYHGGAIGPCYPHFVKHLQFGWFPAVKSSIFEMKLGHLDSPPFFGGYPRCTFSAQIQPPWLPRTWAAPVSSTPLWSLLGVRTRGGWMVVYVKFEVRKGNQRMQMWWFS